MVSVALVCVGVCGCTNTWEQSDVAFVVEAYRNKGVRDDGLRAQSQTHHHRNGKHDHKLLASGTHMCVCNNMQTRMSTKGFVTTSSMPLQAAWVCASTAFNAYDLCRWFHKYSAWVRHRTWSFLSQFYCVGVTADLLSLDQQMQNAFWDEPSCFRRHMCVADATNP